MPPHRRARVASLLLYVAGCHVLLCATMPEPAPLDPALVYPSAATPTGGGTIPAFPEQSDTVTSATCPLAPSPFLLPAVRSSCAAADDDSGALPSRLRCCPALAAWLLAAYAPTGLTPRPARAASAAVVDMPVPPDDSEACAGAADRALRAGGAVLPRPRGGNGTCDVAFCYCGVRLRRMACGPLSPAQGGGAWAPAEEVARRLENDCAQPGVPGCSKCLRALTEIKPNHGGGAVAAPAGTKKKAGHPSENDHDCQLMGIMWLLQRNATRYGAAVTSVIQALMAVDEASAAGVAAAGPSAACSLPVDDMPLPAEYAQLNGASGASGVCCFHTILLLAVLSFRVGYSL